MKVWILVSEFEFTRLNGETCAGSTWLASSWTK